MFGWLFGTDKKEEPHWTVIYAEDGVSASLNDPRKIPRWLRKRILNLERIEPLDNSVRPTGTGGEVGAAGNRRGAQARHRTPLPHPDLSWPSPDEKWPL